MAQVLEALENMRRVQHRQLRALRELNFWLERLVTESRDHTVELRALGDLALEMRQVTTWALEERDRQHEAAEAQAIAAAAAHGAMVEKEMERLKQQKKLKRKHHT
jgi:hypothetical protein